MELGLLLADVVGSNGMMPILLRILQLLLYRRLSLALFLGLAADHWRITLIG